MILPERPIAPAPASHPTHPMETVIGYILLGGVIASVLLVLAGLVWRWAGTGEIGFDYPIGGENLLGFIRADIGMIATDPRPRALVSLGVAVLMFTPYVRVLVSVVFFALVERNFKYTMITGFVLAVLTYSLLLR